MKNRVLIIASLLLLVVSFSVSAVALKPYKVQNVGDIKPSSPIYMVGDEYTSVWVSNYYNRGTMMFNLKNSYRVFTCTIGPTDDVSLGSEHTIDFYVDGQLAKSCYFEGGDFPQDIEVNLNYQRQLKIETDGKLAIVNADFK